MTKGTGTIVRNVRSVKKDSRGLIPKNYLDMIDAGSLRIVGVGADALIAKSRRANMRGSRMFGRR